MNLTKKHIMKYKLKVGLEGKGVSYKIGDMIEISDAQLQPYIDKDMIEVLASTISKVDKPKKSEPKKTTKQKAKKNKV